MAEYVFQRYELKYLLTAEQYRIVRAEIEKRMCPDIYGETTIQSLYLDTEDCRLVRASIEGPTFKEKLRLRCYGLNDCDKPVFVEMKRKADGVVYKRRISCKEGDVPGILAGNTPPTQIGRELAYFLRYYTHLEPQMLVLYDRSAYYDPAGDLRVTLDRNVRYRTEQLDFHTSLEGVPLLPSGAVLMEVKAGTAFPLWVCDLLSREKIAKQSFSKYGAAYTREYRNHIGV